MSVSDDITEFKRSGSPYRKDLNVALLTLNEEGILTKLKFKWWEQKDGGGACIKVAFFFWDFFCQAQSNLN